MQRRGSPCPGPSPEGRIRDRPQEPGRASADHRLRIEALGPHGFETRERSALLPHLPVEELPRFVRMGVESNLYDMLVAFKEWLARL